VYGKCQGKHSSFGDCHPAHQTKSVRKLVLSDSTVCNAETHYLFDQFGVTRMVLVSASKDDFKKIEKEIQEDAVPYLRDIRYETIIVFIYDASASVQEHDVTKGALLQIPGVSGVVIVSRPSQLQNAPA
jgi:hypothetical protein